MWCAPLLGLATHVFVPPEQLWIAGKLTLRRPDGAWISAADGRFVLRTWRGGWTEREVEFSGGLFTVRIPREATRQEIVGLRSTLGTGCVPWRDKRAVEGPFVWQDLYGCIAEPSVLKVLDPESGEALDCVDIAPPGPRDDWVQWYRARHGDAIELYHCGDDWNSLVPDDWRVPWRVRAPGRVPATVPFGPGPKVVYLERAGTLSVTFEGPVPSTRHTFLEITCAESGFEYRERIDPRGVPLFEGLRPAPYTVRVVHEFLDFRRVVRCERIVHVHPDSLASERLAVTPIVDETDGPWEPFQLERTR